MSEDKSLEDTWVYLTTAENEFEYNVIKGQLTQNDITCVGKGKDFDLLDSGFLTVILGPCVPVDILVPKDMYEAAKEILDSKVSDEELEQQALNSPTDENV